jgi:hypothetical protein
MHNLGQLEETLSQFVLAKIVEWISRRCAVP